MNHQELFTRNDNAPALIDGLTGESVTFAELSAEISRRAEELSALSGAIVFLGASTSVEFVVDLFALLQVDATVALLDPKSPAQVLRNWIDLYQPEAWWGLANLQSARTLIEPAARRRESILLPTSGSTGSPKFVRLTAANLVVNADQIVSALRIDEKQRVMAHLPLHYSYGLSVLNSHLRAGSTVVLCDVSSLRTQFWDAMRDQDVTTLPGVPFSYELFIRMGLLSMNLPALKHVTQAGGRLATDQILKAHAALTPRGVQMWIMYGQTEATARISVLPSEALPEHVGSVGFAIPGSSVEIERVGQEDDGEIIFNGGNVMLGYAESRKDINGVDVLQGRLRTGDLGHVDSSGYLWVVGRSRRIAKVFGTRVNLDDIETKLSSWGIVAAVDQGDGVSVYVERRNADGKTSRGAEKLLSFPPGSVRLQVIDEMPTLPSGKINYQSLEPVK